MSVKTPEQGVFSICVLPCGAGSLSGSIACAARGGEAMIRLRPMTGDEYRAWLAADVRRVPESMVRAGC